MEEKKTQGHVGKEAEDQAQADHFQAWDKFWGRPGYGAPRQTGVAHKENLMKMLHYPAQVNYTSQLLGTLSTFLIPGSKQP